MLLVNTFIYYLSRSLFLFPVACSFFQQLVVYLKFYLFISIIFSTFAPDFTSIVWSKADSLFVFYAVGNIPSPYYLHPKAG